MPRAARGVLGEVDTALLTAEARMGAEDTRKRSLAGKPTICLVRSDFPPLRTRAKSFAVPADGAQICAGRTWKFPEKLGFRGVGAAEGHSISSLADFDFGGVIVKFIDSFNGGGEFKESECCE
mmetsp:Transcript_75996/g.134482  ORF Transcript_75996/g.134482 Transcript_75996/m.134482 type:complete len:123 (-) Transcript_75996:2-370(-)